MTFWELWNNHPIIISIALVAAIETAGDSISRIVKRWHGGKDDD